MNQEINFTYVILSILVMAIITYLIRAVPFAAFRKKIKNKYICSFLEYIPYSVLAAMTFPAIITSTNSVFSSICGLIVALILAFYEKSLLTVSLGASAAAFISTKLISLFV